MQVLAYLREIMQNHLRCQISDEKVYMLKAMLVDDELLEREDIRNLIPWAQLGIVLARMELN
jgi:hypothetical protein